MIRLDFGRSLGLPREERGGTRAHFPNIGWYSNLNGYLRPLKDSVLT